MAGSATAQDRQDVDSPFTAEERAHWAFQPIVRKEIPLVRNADRIRTPIDAFLLKQLEADGLGFSEPAGKRALLRRAKFDLLGLPPTPEEIDTFLNDSAPDAYERLIDQLLASHHYGEKWGRYWLDLVRFAETAGFNADQDRPLAYKYRDYVIQAFNAGKPYDRFMQEQLAGDELFPENRLAQVATGYCRMWPDESNASNVELARQDALNDLTSNVGAVFLGLSVGCAQCHDHKFDPILQQDFYQLQAFFTGIVLKDRVPIGTTEQLTDYHRKLHQWYDQTAAARNELHKIEQTARARVGRIKRKKFPQIVLDAIDTASEDRTALQHQLAFWSERQIRVNEKQLLAQMSEEQKHRREQLNRRMAELRDSLPKPPAELAAMAVVEVASGPPPTYLLLDGSYNKPEEQLQPDILTVLRENRRGTVDVVPPRPNTSGRRAALALWLTDPRHPLTSRVMVNRLWQEHFGRGLVSNANDFGTQTPPPSHPELLDWLASELIAHGWNLKAIHRVMMTSAAYRQSSFRRGPDEPEPRAVSVDPGNRLYWHFPRRRLSAESVRDAMLAVAGRLNHKMFGPGVKPLLPPKFSTRHAWKPTDNLSERDRRSVYIFAKRNLPYPFLQAFDFPDMHESCARRPVTTVAPQALMLLNSEMVLEFAADFAVRILREFPADRPEQLVIQAYVLALGRGPQPEEKRAAVRFLRMQQAELLGQLDEQERQSLIARLPVSADVGFAASFTDFCHALLNANEFIYVD